MKASQQPKPFVPVTIILESQDEVDKLFALINYSPFVHEFNLNDWIDELQSFNSDNYMNYYKQVKKIIRENNEI